MLADLKRRVCAANRRLPACGLAPLNFGNASGLDRKRGLIAIKPSGADYAALRPADIVLVDMSGRVVEGRPRPSTDTATHVALYRAFPSIGGVVHTHSPSATAFAQAERPIPALGTTHADYFRGPVPITRALRRKEIEGSYETETGRAIAEAFADLDPLDVPAVLVNRHAPFVWGRSVEQAVEIAQALEFCAACALAALGLNRALGPIGTGLLRRHFFRKHGTSAYYGQNARPGPRRSPPTA